MKFAILGFNQEQVVKLAKEHDGRIKKLDVVDLLILNEISDFMNRGKVVKYTIDDKVYFSISYATIIDDLPILDIKKQALADRIEKLVFLGIIEKIVIKNQGGTFVAFRMGCEYERLIYSCKSSETTPTSSLLHSQTYQTTNQNTIYNNNIYIKEKEDNKLSSTKKDENELVEKLYLMYPTRCPKRGVSLGKSRKDKERIRKLLKTYSIDEITKVFKHEIETKYEKSYMQNFSTFLNNFPDPNMIEKTNLFDNCESLAVCDSKKDNDNNLVINGVTYR